MTVKSNIRLIHNGVGFDITAARERAIHGMSCGILGMQERAELLGGCLTIESSPTHGTCLTATFPLETVAVVERDINERDWKTGAVVPKT